MNHSTCRLLASVFSKKSFVSSPLPGERFSAWHQNPPIIWLQLTNHPCVLLYPSLALCSSQTGKLTAPGKGLHPFWPLPELKCLPIPQIVLFFPFFKFQLECHTTKPFLPSSLWEESLHRAQPLTHHDACVTCVSSHLSCSTLNPPRATQMALIHLLSPWCPAQHWHVSLPQCWWISRWRMSVAKSWRQTGLDTLNQPCSQKSCSSWCHSSKLGHLFS